VIFYNNVSYVESRGILRAIHFVGKPKIVRAVFEKSKTKLKNFCP